MNPSCLEQKADTVPILRTLSFVGMAVIQGIIPAAHHVTFASSEEIAAMYTPVLVMAILYITGGTLYGLRIPERWLPGHFDLCHSHVIHHCTVLAAIWVHYWNCMTMFDAKKDLVCPV